MMHKPYTEFLYAENDLYQTVTLPYGFSGIIGVLYCKIALHCIAFLRNLKEVKNG